jgi:LacI family transcriptional regulator
MALAVIGAIRDAGLLVPQDVSVIGFDDIQLAAVVRPGLTTVAQPLYEIGTRAADLLIGCITAPVDESAMGSPQPPEMMPHRLVIRETTGPPPPNATPLPT